MKKLSVVSILLILALSLSSQAMDVISYVQGADPSFKWEKVSEGRDLSCPYYNIKLTSQTWQGIIWTHDLQVFMPRRIDYPETAFMLVTGGSPGKEGRALAALIAMGTGCPVAVLYGIPNQPLFDGLKEDNLIAHTFVKTLETEDLTWPLLLPMTKSAVRAMDAVQSFAKSDLEREITGFVVCGASKRGWTTWLTAAVDPARVKAIVPLVYDNLNLKAQMRHQIQCWGKYSEMIEPYTKRGLLQVLETERGASLSQIVDPWVYRDRITMPKLIVNGTNDPYWTLTSLNIYWRDLVGPKYVTYVPNAGHELVSEDNPLSITALISNIASFTRLVASGSPLPEITWKYIPGNKAQRLNIMVNSSVPAAKLWTTKSSSLDFRRSKWESAQMEPTDTGFTSKMTLPENGYIAVFGEVTVPTAGRKVVLSTQIRVFNSSGPVTAR